MWDCAWPVGTVPTILSVRIDEGDRLVELGGDVEQAGLGPEERAVRADAVAEIDVADDLPRGDVDDDHVGAVGAGLADAGVAVDGDEGEAAVGRRR